MANSGRAENKAQVSSLCLSFSKVTHTCISIKRHDDGNTVRSFRTKLSFYSVWQNSMSSLTMGPCLLANSLWHLQCLFEFPLWRKMNVAPWKPLQSEPVRLTTRHWSTSIFTKWWFLRQQLTKWIWRQLCCQEGLKNSWVTTCLLKQVTKKQWCDFVIETRGWMKSSSH